MAATKNIIFDLGGVLLNIDYNKTISAFKELGVENFEDMFTQFHVNELFAKLEKGKISNDDFYAAVKKVIPRPVSNQQVDTAWNAMLLDFRTDSLVFLERLAQKYTLFLLSNTNSLHLKRFQQIFTRDTGKPLLDDYFSKCWYSHRIGMRKPEKEDQRWNQDDAATDPDETTGHSRSHS